MKKRCIAEMIQIKKQKNRALNTYFMNVEYEDAK